MLAECSTAEVMTCRLVGLQYSALWMAVLLLSVPQPVKMMSVSYTHLTLPTNREV